MRFLLARPYLPHASDSSLANRFDAEMAVSAFEKAISIEDELEVAAAAARSIELLSTVRLVEIMAL